MKKMWVVLFVLAAGCAKESPTAPAPAVGRLELSVNPAAVGFAGGIGVGGAVCPAGWPLRWGPFNWVLKEVGGAPVTVTSFRWAVHNAANVQVADDDLSSQIAGNFGTPGATLPVAAGETLTSRSVYDCEATGFTGGKATFTVKGTTTSGAPVESVAVLTLLAP